MITKSFSVDIPKVMFNKMYVDYCERHGRPIPDRNNEKLNAILDKVMNWLWVEYYGDDICAFLDGNLPEYFDDLEWDDSVEVTKAVAIMYVDYCAENPFLQIDLETYWKDLMRQAMDAQEFIFPPEAEAVRLGII